MGDEHDERHDPHEQALAAIRDEVARLRQTQEQDLRAARERIAELEAELAAERGRVRELADQMTHMIDELGQARRLWKQARAQPGS